MFQQCLRVLGSNLSRQVRLPGRIVPRLGLSTKAPEEHSELSELDQIPDVTGADEPKRSHPRFFDEDLENESSRIKPKTPPTREEIFRQFPAQQGAVREAWVETLDSGAPSTDRMVPLHPEIWSIRPRLDLIFANVEWQSWFKEVWYTHERNRHQMPPGIGRPWPQKGLGRARHRTIRSPLWPETGGKSGGAQNPRSHFYMLPYHVRVHGLIHTLAVKFAQDDLHVVQDLNIPTDDPDYIENFIESQGWALTTLFVDNNDIMPANITAATEKINHLNLLPVYSLNVHSMLYHKTLVITESALNMIESKLLFALHRTDVQDARIRSQLCPRPPAFEYRS